MPPGDSAAGKACSRENSPLRELDSSCHDKLASGWGHGLRCDACQTRRRLSVLYSAPYGVGAEWRQAVNRRRATASIAV
eukprot:5522504-Pleurochrysis_carterae.AAC.1